MVYNSTPPSTDQITSVQNSAIPTYELTLGQLFSVLVRSRLWLFAFAVAGASAGGIYGVMRPAPFSYFTSVEIASYADESSIKPVEDLLTAKTRLDAIVIPGVLEEMRKSGNMPAGFGISVLAPKEGMMLRLESRIPIEFEELVGSIHAAVIDGLKKEQSRSVEAQRQNMQLGRQTMDDQLASLEGDEQLLRAQLLQVENDLKLAAEELKRIDQLLIAEEESRKQALSERVAGTQGLALALIQAEIARIETKRGQVRDKLDTDLPQVRQRVLKLLQDNQRSQVTMRARAAAADARLSALREARGVTATIRASAASGAGTMIKLVLGLLFGLAAGVISVLFRDIARHQRKHANFPSTGTDLRDAVP